MSVIKPEEDAMNRSIGILWIITLETPDNTFSHRPAVSCPIFRNNKVWEKETVPECQNLNHCNQFHAAWNPSSAQISGIGDRSK